MKIIIGLGNKGKQYNKTRHNIGFEVIDKLGYDHNIEINKLNHRAFIGRGTINNVSVLLAKPQTFMNLSGESVKEIVKFYKVDLKDIIIIYDDISLDLGTIKVRQSGSGGGQNGMKNIIEHLGTQNINRVKVGIGSRPTNFTLSDYVLSKFKKSEFDNFLQGCCKACASVETFVTSSIDNAMNQHNCN